MRAGRPHHNEALVFEVSTVDKPPREGTDVVEELESGVGSFGVDGACTEEDLQVAIDFLG